MQNKNQSLSQSFRFLTLFVLMMMSVGSVWGQTETTYQTTCNSSWSAAGGTNTLNNIEWTYTKATYLSYSNSKLQIGSKNNPQTTSWTISTPISSFGNNVTIKSVAITAYTTAKTASFDISVGGSSVSSGNLDTSSKTYSATGINATSGDIVITMTGSSTSKAIYLSEISVTFSVGGDDKASAPTITKSCNFSTTPFDVTITNNEDGATVYYSTDGNDPTTSTETSFTEASKTIQISENTTVKAMAAKEGKDNSSVTSATFTYVAPLTTMDAIFAKATEVGSTATECTVTFNNWVVSGVANNNAYVTDGTKGFIIYKYGHGFKVGDILNGTILATIKLYNGSAEFTDITSSTSGLSVTTGGTLTPQEVSISDLSSVNTGAPIIVKNVTYNGTNLVDASSNAIKPYNSLYSGMSFTSGKKYNVTGVYLQNSSTKEIMPRSAEDIAEVQATKYDITIDQSITNGTISASETSAAEGVEVTLTKNPKDGFKFSFWDVYKTGEQSTKVKVADDKFNMPAYAVTVSASFVAKDVYAITWIANGVQYVQTNVTEGNPLVLPTAPSAIGSYVFQGWITEENYYNENAAPTYVTAETVPTANAKYYAVYAKQGTGNSLTKMAGTSTFYAGDNIVVVASGTTGTTTWSYLMYQETISTSYVSYKGFDGIAETITADVKNYFTLSTGTADNTWKLGDVDNGYLYNASSNNLTVDTQNFSDWTIAWNANESKFSIKNGERWLSCRSDLTGDNQFKFRGGGTSSASGTVYFDIYKLNNKSYSNFSTSVASVTLSISSANWSTFISPFDVEIPEEMSAYIVIIDDNKLKFEDDILVDRVLAANTPVVIYNLETAVKTFTGVSEATQDEYTEGALVGTLVAKDNIPAKSGDNQNYVLQNGNAGVGFYKLTSTASLKANRCYLSIPTSGEVKSAFSFDEIMTGINNILAPGQNVRQGIYDMNGRKLDAPQKGMNIINGVKVFIK